MSLFKHLIESLREPGFWAYSTWLTVVTNYRRSRLGMVWLLVPPALYIWGLGAFFSSMQNTPLNHFAAHVAVGITVFRLVTTVITDSAGVLSSNQGFILDGRVRLTDFVLRVVARALFYTAVAIPLVLLALFLYGDVRLDGVLMLFVSLPLLLLNVVWLSVVFALLGARYPDTEQFINNAFLFLFLLTPVVWFAEQAPVDSLRGMLMRVNPLFHIIEAIRAPLLGEAVDSNGLIVMAVMAAIGWLVAALLYRRYARFVPLWI
ncbi:ABC-2 type transporter [compost metagenome]